MPTVADFARKIELAPDDIAGSLCLRATARATPLALSGFSLSAFNWSFDERQILLIFKSLMISWGLNSAMTPERAIKAQIIYNLFSDEIRTSQSFIMFRACIRANLPIDRRAKMEELRRCMQSINDSAQNAIRIQRDYSTNPKTISSFIWKDFDDHIDSLIGRAETSSLGFPADGASPFARNWQLAKNTLISQNESWKIWIEWFEYRFGGMAGENVPVVIWRDIENAVISDEKLFSSSDATITNKLFIEHTLRLVENFAEHKASSRQLQGGDNFSVDDNSIIDVVPGHTNQEPPSSYANAVVSEVYNSARTMLKECDSNSAVFLREQIENYLDTVNNDSIGDPVKVVIRGDIIRSSLEHQLKRPKDTDLPVLTDKALLCLKNLIRAHNLMVSIFPELTEIERGLNSAHIRRIDDISFGLKRILNYANSRAMLTHKSREAFEAILSSNLRARSETKLSGISGLA